MQKNLLLLITIWYITMHSSYSESYPVSSILYIPLLKKSSTKNSIFYNNTVNVHTKTSFRSQS